MVSANQTQLLDDLFLLVDENQPLGCWPRGRIIAVHPGRDGQIRVVDVRTQCGTYRRAVNKLKLLDLNEREEAKRRHQWGVCWNFVATPNL